MSIASIRTKNVRRESMIPEKSLMERKWGVLPYQCRGVVMLASQTGTFLCISELVMPTDLIKP